ncbi:helix-turn-helix domain-containing protein [Flavobacterium sp. NRK1]|uniref:helix-turn-helix domain-containing protein n=1 Tax=Flavobacterium sp. NRK1 TaxID=2954929 RepID=UPI002093CA6F|nr:helix-turn-helix domain-containing protein [Flavobacterium sp. NRK1]MCO6147397.1 helix-turn-helix domain-containing protein [Flavobacterium sp. NRK1]
MQIEDTPKITLTPGWLAKEVLSFKEALALLDISASMLYKLTHQRAISFYKPNGKLIYFKKEDLLSWMLSNKQPSNDEVSSDFLNKLKS